MKFNMSAARPLKKVAAVLLIGALTVACGGGSGDADAGGDGGDGGDGGTDEQTTGAAADTPAGEPIKVGVLMDLSETYAFIGAPSVAGVRTAVDAINRSGGVNGREIELVIEDDRSDAQAARTLLEDMANSGIVAVIGPNASATMVPLAPVIQELEIPSLTLAAVADLHDPAQPYLYATGLHVGRSAQIDAEFIAEDMADAGIEAPTVAALSLDTPAVSEFRETLESAIPELGGELVLNEVVAPDATDMANAMIPIANAQPDYVPVGLLSTQLPGVVSSLRNRGVADAAVINYFVAADRATFEAVDDERFYAVRQYAEPDEEDPSEGLTRMIEHAEAAGQTDEMVNAYFTYGYVTTQLLAEALATCESECTGAAVDEALSGIENFETDGLSGPLGVTEDDHYFVNYGRVFGWDGTNPVAVTDWIGGRG